MENNNLKDLIIDIKNIISTARNDVLKEVNKKLL